MSSCWKISFLFRSWTKNKGGWFFVLQRNTYQAIVSIWPRSILGLIFLVSSHEGILSPFNSFLRDLILTWSRVTSYKLKRRSLSRSKNHLRIILLDCWSISYLVLVWCWYISSRLNSHAISNRWSNFTISILFQCQIELILIISSRSWCVFTSMRWGIRSSWAHWHRFTFISNNIFLFIGSRTRI